MKRNLAPVHPGEILREEYIIERNLTVSEVAKGLGVPRPTLAAIVGERAGINSELAVKLSEAFGNTAQFWVNLQKNYELWQAEKKVNRAVIRHFDRPIRGKELKWSSKIAPNELADKHFVLVLTR